LAEAGLAGQILRLQEQMQIQVLILLLAPLHQLVEAVEGITEQVGLLAQEVQAVVVALVQRLVTEVQVILLQHLHPRAIVAEQIAQVLLVIQEVVEVVLMPQQELDQTERLLLEEMAEQEHHHQLQGLP
jgi:hypothetical protein